MNEKPKKREAKIIKLEPNPPQEKIEIIPALLKGDIEFSDPEQQAELMRLKKAHEEAKTEKEKAEAEFAIRQFLLS